MTETAESKPTAKQEPEAKAKMNKAVLLIALGMAAAIAAAVFFAFKFVEEERARDLQDWQIRLGIVADSRSAAIGEWLENQYAAVRELAQNESLQLYMTELSFAEGDKTAVTDEPAQAAYLRNLLIATADRTGFAAPPPTGAVAANVERAGIAGLGLVDDKARPVVSTPGMPPMNPDMTAAVAKALNGKPALINAYIGPTGEPTMGFALPVYAIQGDESAGIGAVIGMKILGKDLWKRLEQPGSTEETAETYLVREDDNSVTYLSPLADGTEPMKRTLSLDTPNLAAAQALDKPGSFGIQRAYSGKDVLATSRRVPGIDWLVIRSVTTAEALAETERRTKTLMVVFVLIIVGVTITIIAVWRHGSSVRATQAAEQFRISSERFENLSKFMRLISNSQPTHIIAVDEHTQYTFANEPAAKSAGIAPADMMGKTMASVIGPVKAQAYAEINKEVFKDLTRRSEIHHFEEDGQEFQVIQSDHIPLQGDRDHPPGVLMILSDVTELFRERRRSEQMLRQLIDTLVSVVDRRDPFSANHSTRVAEVARCIADEMGLDAVEQKTADIGGSLMNLGKIFIPPDLLTKTGDLTAEERKMIGSAYLTSADLLEGVSFEGPVVDAVRQMGEHWDGSGPLGLQEEEILRPARILAVANTFVGMVSARAYRDAMTFEKAANILLEESGTKFDRKAVSALINFLENRQGTQEWAHYRERPKDAAAE